ncbi:MAG: lipoyl(octanoyl) transferase LipB [Balneolales bacterium]
MKLVNFQDIGRVSFRETWKLQGAIQNRLIGEKLAERDNRLTGSRSNDVLLMVEHPHVFTLGKSGDVRHLLKTEQELDDLDAEFVKIDRGGDITYHGPGQIVAYPILDLTRYFTDIHKYLRYLEEVVIRTCADYQIKAGRIKGLTGVWVNGAKIAAFGIRCSRWVTMHGLALNVHPDLDYFSHIIPCGIGDKKVTSLQELLKKKINIEQVKVKLKQNFEEVFDVSLQAGGLLPELPAGNLRFHHQTKLFGP